MEHEPHSENAVEELRRLEQVAERGESEETPWLVLGWVWIVCAVAFLVVAGTVFVAYRLAT
jgi:hypothetical protein